MIPLAAACSLGAALVLTFGTAPNTAADARRDAYRGQPPLAYVSHGHVMILDGKGHAARRVKKVTGACCVEWAPDAAHLAFRRGHALWVTGPDGSGTRRVAASVSRWAWASDGDALATIPSDGNGLRVDAADDPGVHRTFLSGTRVLDLAWAPHGRRLAVVAEPHREPTTAGTLLDLLMLEVPGPYGDCPRLCPEPPVRVSVDQRLGGGSTTALAGWSPDADALVVWNLPSGATPHDRVPLQQFPPSGGRPMTLATTAVQRSWVRWSKAGDRLLVVAGADRDDGQPRVLDLCTVASGCRAVTGTGEVAGDPAWSDAGEMAFTRGAPGDPTHRRLWLADGDGTGAREVSVTGEGVQAPEWLPDTHHLVYVRDGSLWLFDTATRAAPVAIAGRLGTPIGGAVLPRPYSIAP